MTTDDWQSRTTSSITRKYVCLKRLIWPCVKSVRCARAGCTNTFDCKNFLDSTVSWFYYKWKQKVGRIRPKWMLRRLTHSHLLTSSILSITEWWTAPIQLVTCAAEGLDCGYDFPSLLFFRFCHRNFFQFSRIHTPEKCSSLFRSENFLHANARHETRRRTLNMTGPTVRRWQTNTVQLRSTSY